jgi:hypothetical protein
MLFSSKKVETVTTQLHDFSALEEPREKNKEQEDRVKSRRARLRGYNGTLKEQKDRALKEVAAWRGIGIILYAV